MNLTTSKTDKNMVYFKSLKLADDANFNTEDLSLDTKIKM